MHAWHYYFLLVYIQEVTEMFRIKMCRFNHLSKGGRCYLIIGQSLIFNCYIPFFAHPTPYSLFLVVLMHQVKIFFANKIRFMQEQ